MPQKAWSAKRERQYVHIKHSLLEQGKPEPWPKRSRHGSSTRKGPNTASR